MDEYPSGETKIDIDSLFKEGVTLYERQDYSEAIRIFGRIINNNPHYPEVKKYMKLAQQGQEESQKRKGGIRRMATRRQEILEVLETLQTNIQGFKGVVLADERGLIIESILQEGIDGKVVAAKGGIIGGTCRETAEVLKCGTLKLLSIEGRDGYITLGNVVGNKGTLILITSPDAKLGMVFLEVEDAAVKLGSIL